MNNLNSLILEGVVIGEPHYLEATHRVEFAIDSVHYHKNDRGEEFAEHYQFDVVSFGEFGKYILSHLKNGTKIRLVGRLKQEKWEDSESVSHSKVYIVVEHIEFRKTK
jgi:single-strand DNA-binding protein